MNPIRRISCICAAVAFCFVGSGERLMAQNAMAPNRLAQNTRSTTSLRSTRTPLGKSTGTSQAFLEAKYDLQIAASDMGVITEILVVPGQTVQRGELLARLDDRVLKTSLEIAKASKEAVAAKEAAKIEVQIRERQRDSYAKLLDAGNANQRELDRAEEAASQANARWKSRIEELVLRDLEYQRTLAQLEQRRVISPIDGIVVKVVKQVGEFVSPTDPVVFHVVDLSSLQATFAVPFQQAASLRKGQTLRVRISSSPELTDATVQWVSPIVEASTGTKSVCVLIANEQGNWTSGMRCSLVDVPKDTAKSDPAEFMSGVPRKTR